MKNHREKKPVKKVQFNHRVKVTDGVETTHKLIYDGQKMEPEKTEHYKRKFLSKNL